MPVNIVILYLKIDISTDYSFPFRVIKKQVALFYFGNILKLKRCSKNFKWGTNMTTLLVVDEEVNTRLLYKDEFRDEGYEVTVAETTEEAMEIIHQSKPDIITLDIKLPGTNAIEFLRKIKEEESEIPVVLCSAYARYKKDLRLAVCDAFVVQSADLTELKTVVKRILSHKQSDLVLRAFKNGEIPARKKKYLAFTPVKAAL